MFDIWMCSIARAGGIETPLKQAIPEPVAALVAQSEPQAVGRFERLARWLKPHSLSAVKGRAVAPIV